MLKGSSNGNLSIHLRVMKMAARTVCSSIALVTWLLAPLTAWADCDCGSTDPARPCQGKEVRYTSNDIRRARSGGGRLDGPRQIRIEFRCDGGPCSCGRYANQWDYWVAPGASGTVEITGMTPGWTGTYNGWMLDPETQHGHCYDARRSYKASTCPANMNPSPLEPYLVQPPSGSAVVMTKAASLVEAGENCTDTPFVNSNGPCLEMAEALAVVAEIPPGAGSKAFRPNYFGRRKFLFSTDLMDLAFLPALASVPRARGKGWTERNFRSVGLDSLYEWDVQYLHARENFMNTSGYDADMALGYGLGLLQLSIDDGNRNLGAIRYIQRGIDLYSIFLQGSNGASHPLCGGWKGSGGYGAGRIFPILFAATALGQDSWIDHIRRVVNSGPTGRRCFAETGTIQPPNPSGANIALYGVTAATSPGASRGSRDLADPLGNYDASGNPNSTCGGGYHLCCTYGNYKPGALGVRLMPKLETAFPWEHFLDYVDRMEDRGPVCAGSTNGMELDPGCVGGIDAGKPCTSGRECSRGKCEAGVKLHGSLFSDWMWYQYRDDSDSRPSRSTPASHSGDP